MVAGIPWRSGDDPLRPSKSCILNRFSTPYIKPFRHLVGVGILNFVTPETCGGVFAVLRDQVFQIGRFDARSVVDGDLKLGRSLAHWFVPVRTASKIGLNKALFLTCK